MFISLAHTHTHTVSLLLMNLGYPGKKNHTTKPLLMATIKSWTVSSPTTNHLISVSQSDFWRFEGDDNKSYNHVHLTKLFSKSLGWVAVDSPNIWGVPKMVVPQNGWFEMETLLNGWFGGTTIFGNIHLKIRPINREDWSWCPSRLRKRFLALDYPWVQWIHRQCITHLL